MGARCTFVFKQSEDLAVALYSHWGEDSIFNEITNQLSVVPFLVEKNEEE